jgi:hypothetical protein
MNTNTRKTPVASQELGVTYHQLMGLIRFNKIKPPARDSSGDYAWSDEDLANARKALAAGRRRNGGEKAVPA